MITDAKPLRLHPSSLNPDFSKTARVTILLAAYEAAVEYGSASECEEILNEAERVTLTIEDFNVRARFLDRIEEHANIHLDIFG